MFLKLLYATVLLDFETEYTKAIIRYMFTIGWIIIILSLFVILSGIIGIFRFPDFYTKIHAAGVIECCGVSMCLVGLSCLQPNLISSFKLLFGALLIFLLNPVTTHALAKASLIKRKFFLDQIENESENFVINHVKSIDQKDV